MTDASPEPAGLPVSREFLSFAIIGASALLVDLAALHIALHVFGWDFYAARAFSYLTAVSYTWVLNRTFTFRDANRRRALHQWVRFIAANAVGGGVNYATSAIIVTWGPSLIPAFLASFLYLLPYFATACGSVAGLGFNFVMSKKLVFRRS